MNDLGTAEFISKDAILTFGGASLAVTVITNAARMLLKTTSPWVGFLVSVAIVYGGAYATNQLTTPVSWILALVNTCLLFCTAAGITDFARGAVTPRDTPDVAPHARRRVRFLDPWFPR